MKLELQGSEEELARLRVELQKNFPDQKVVFGELLRPAPRFGSREPLGEAVTLTVVVTVVATTLTSEIVKDVYELIKTRFFGVKVKTIE